MKQYDTILFDLDGTITDSKEGIFNSIDYMLSKLHMSAEKAHDESIIGPPIRFTLEKVLNIPTEKVEEALEHYRVYFKEKGMLEITLYPGISDLLNELTSNKHKLFVATSKPTVFAKKILEHSMLNQYFEEICGSSLDDSMVGKKEIIQYALRAEDEHMRSNCIMIGDKIHDIEGAKSNQIDSIGVMYGYGTQKEIENAKPTYIAQTVQDIEKILQA